MLKKITENAENITLLFSKKRNSKALNPKLEVSSEFHNDLVKFIKEKYKIDNPVVDINFMHDIDMTEVLVVNNKGDVWWEFRSELVLEKEPAQADNS